MKTQFAVADVGTLLLHPERYDSKAAAEAAIEAHDVTAPLYQVVELRFDDLKHEAPERLQQVRQLEQKRHKELVAEDVAREVALTDDEKEQREDRKFAQRRKQLDDDEAERKVKKQRKETAERDEEERVLARIAARKEKG